MRAELQKLSERVAKDPLSTLFVPFAEELRKEGQIDRAVQVLRDGLRTHPHYVSARVSLGKILLEKGNLQEAKEEFERVVELAPENLLAQKRLGEIYRIRGQIPEAIRAYRAVLHLHSSDEESRQILGHLEQSSRVETPVEPAPAASALIPEGPPGPVTVPASPPPAGRAGVGGEGQPEEAAFLPVDLAPETGTLVRSHDLASTYEIVQEESPAQSEAAEEAVVTEAFPAEVVEPLESAAPAWSLPAARLPDGQGRAGVGGEALPLEAGEEGLEPLVAEEAAVSSEVAFVPAGTAALEEAVATEEPAPSFTPSEAEALVEQGLYDQALAVYLDLLARDPANALCRQRVEELLAFSDLLKQGVNRAVPAREPAITEPAGATDSHPAALRRELVIERLETWLSHLRLRRAAP
ncbi:MAG: tetratricopeptide repeat protein [Nitrospirae bacterium]|nr:tetratricopeptide repeat protein [Nitrospirota bacterium]